MRDKVLLENVRTSSKAEKNKEEFIWRKNKTKQKNKAVLNFYLVAEHLWK